MLCSFMMEYDIHTILDFLTLIATCWVIYTLFFQLSDSYQAEEDSIKTWYVVSMHSFLPPVLRKEGSTCCQQS